MSNSVLLGTTEIQTTDHTSFADGFQSGYAYFNLAHRGKPFTEDQLYNFIAETIIDPTHTRAYCTGQVVGLVTSLLEKYPRPEGEHVFVFRVLVPEGR